MITCRKFFQLFLVFLILLCETCVLGVLPSGGAPQIKCLKKERQALLNFKQGLTGTNYQLSSWGTKEIQKDCCKWEGVRCHNRTGNVIELNLYGQYLSGVISPSLLELKYLENLNFSKFMFNGPIPVFFGSFTKLKYLILQDAGFEGRIPRELGNLSSLHTLDLSLLHTLHLSLNDLFAENLEWLLPLQSLRNLYLSGIDLSNATDWLKSVNKLPLLRELHLSGCQIPRLTPSLMDSINSFMSLTVLDVSHNNLGSSIYTWLFNYSNNLSDINLSNNTLQGPISDDFSKMVSLVHLDLSHNKLEGGILSFFGNYSSLQSLTLSHNNLSGHMPELMKNLSGPVSNTLKYLYLDLNLISGPLPDTIVELSSLKVLNLGSNKLNGSMPKEYGQLPNLEVLNCSDNEISGVVPDFTLSSSLIQLNLQRNQLSGVLTESIGRLSNLQLLNLGSNHFEGVISESHMLNLSHLKGLDFSLNSHLKFKFQSDWIPPFQLDSLNLRNCKIGPDFPKWLQTQKEISQIDMSIAGISDEIPNWFWNQMSGLYALNLSYNQISGTLPKLDKLVVVDLSSNDFKGPVPQLLKNAYFVKLSKNKFSGKFTFLCNSSYEYLWYLDLSDNQLFGQLPDCWAQLGKLGYLNLANNNFLGKIPPSMGSLSQIEVLQLRNNSFTEELPQSWKASNLLNFIDFGQNKLSGAIPSWIGSNLSNLVILSLSSNNFSGNISQQICNLSKIQVLDLSENNISGTIPKCISNFSAMSSEGSSTLSMGNMYPSLGYVEMSYTAEAFLIWKGRASQYKNTLGLVKIIDLSSNNLTGVIPLEVTSLVGLLALNLSRNCITGPLTTKIGELKSLQFLDLSKNWIFGEIPSSLSQLSFLGVLNLSFNNFTGRIPPDTHLQTFDASSFEGNLGLCGKPLTKVCPGDELPQNPNFNGGANVLDEEEHEDKLVTEGFFLSFALGFVLGFWGVCGTLFFNRSCRHSLFRFLKEMKDWIYTITALKLAKLQRQLQV